MPSHRYGRAASLILALVARGLAQTGYSFAVNGSDARPEVVSFRGTPDDPQPGDLVWIAGWLVRLDGPGHYEFTDAFRSRGHLHLRRGATEWVVGLTSGQLTAADPDTHADLRSVRIDQWDPAIARAVESLAANTPIVVTADALDGDSHTMAELPAGLMHLAVLSANTSHDPASLPNLPALRSLAWGTSHFGSPPTSLAALGACVHLQHLAIAGFTTQPLSLAPLATLAELVHLEVENTQVLDLTANGLPRLRQLQLRWTGLTAAEVLDFQRQHPDCSIRGPVLASQLQERLRGVDAVALQVRVRAGIETATFEPFATTDPGAIAEIVGMLQVVDASEDRFARRASQTLELRQRGQVVARLDLVGGGIRWRDGPWLDDANLTAECAERLQSFCARHDQAVPRAAFLTAAARRAETVRRDQVRNASIEASSNEFLQRVAGTDDGIAIGLRLLGCHDLPWNCPDEFDLALRASILARLTTPPDWDAAITACRGDADASRGLAALWLAPRQGAAPTTDQRAAALACFVPAALRHPEPWNRARMLVALRDEPDGIGLPFLRRAVMREFRLSTFAARRHGVAPTTLPADETSCVNPARRFGCGGTNRAIRGCCCSAGNALPTSCGRRESRARFARRL
jgi:hypothetical protein